MFTTLLRLFGYRFCQGHWAIIPLNAGVCATCHANSDEYCSVCLMLTPAGSHLCDSCKESVQDMLNAEDRRETGHTHFADLAFSPVHECPLGIDCPECGSPWDNPQDPLDALASLEVADAEARVRACGCKTDVYCPKCEVFRDRLAQAGVVLF